MCQNLEARSKVTGLGQQKSLQASADDRKLLRLGTGGVGADSMLLSFVRPRTRILNSGTRNFLSFSSMCRKRGMSNRDDL